MIVPPSGSDDTAALQVALDSGLAILQPGRYHTSDTLRIFDGGVLQGVGFKQTRILSTALIALAGGVSVSSNTEVKYAQVSNLSITPRTRQQNSQVGIDLAGFREGTFRDILLAEFQTGLRLQRPQRTDPCYFNVFDNLHVIDCLNGVNLASEFTPNANRFINLNIGARRGLYANTIGLRLSGYGNTFHGVRIGGGQILYGVIFDQNSGNNLLSGLYLESAPDFGIHCAGTNRHNTIISIHYDGEPTVRVHDPKQQLIII